MNTKNLFLALIAVIFFTACGSNDDTPDPMVDNPDDPITFLEIDPDINLGTITFEETGPSFSLENENLDANPLGNWGRFGEGEGGNPKIEVAYADNPNTTGNTSDKVVQISEPVGVASWAGMFFNLAETITFPEGKEAIAVDFLSPGPGHKVLIKLEDQLAAGTEGKKDTGDIIVETVGTGWETLVFNIPDKTWDKSGTYARFVIIAGFGVTNEAATDYYFDNLAITDTKEVVEPEGPVVLDSWDAFGNTTLVDSVFTFPAAAESWAGFANLTTSVYPFEFPNGGTITFKASAATTTNIKFRFEFKPYPDVDPAYDTTNIEINTTALADYTFTIPSQGTNTFSSLILYIVEKDQPVTITDIVVTETE